MSDTTITTICRRCGFAEAERSITGGRPFGKAFAAVFYAGVMFGALVASAWQLCWMLVGRLFG